VHKALAIVRVGRMTAGADELDRLNHGLELDWVEIATKSAEGAGC